MRTSAVLDALTGFTLLSGRLGLWVGAEAMVYDGWDRPTHVKCRSLTAWGISRCRRQRARWCSIGTSKVKDVRQSGSIGASPTPAYPQAWATDTDGRMRHMVHEVYQTSGD